MIEILGQKTLQQLIGELGSKANRSDLSNEPYEFYHYFPLHIIKDEKDFQKIKSLLFAGFCDKEKIQQQNRWHEKDKESEYHTLWSECRPTTVFIPRGTTILYLNLAQDQMREEYLKVLYPIEINVSFLDVNITRSQNLPDGSSIFVRTCSLRPTGK